MGKAFVIGIAGGSASGKSTLAEKLKEALPSLELCLMHMDSYFKPAEERAMIEAPVTGIPYRDDNHPSSFHLAELRQDLTEAIGNGQYQVILVEGLLTLWDKEILELLDLRLFVECHSRMGGLSGGCGGICSGGSPLMRSQMSIWIWCATGMTSMWNPANGRPI